MSRTKQSGPEIVVRPLPKEPQVVARKLTNEQWQRKYEALGDKLRPKFDKVRSYIFNEIIHSLRRRHELGKDLQEVDDKKATYGQHAVEKMAELLDMDPSLLYNIKKFADDYSPKQLNELVALVEAGEKEHGYGISWSHVTQLLRVRDVNKREQLQQDIIEQRLTVQELCDRRERVAPLPDTKTPKTGRPLIKPKDLMGYLSQFESMAGKLYRCYNEVWFGKENSLTDLAHAIEEEDVTEILVTRLNAAADMANTVAVVLDNYMRETRLLAKNFDRDLQARAEKGGDAEESVLSGIE